MSDRRTVTVRDEHGHVSVHDVPDESDVYGWKHWCDHLTSGRYVIVSDESEPPADVVPDTVPDGTIGQVVAWVRGAPVDEDPSDGWAERARQALDAETADGGKDRSSLVQLLTELG